MEEGSAKEIALVSTSQAVLTQRVARQEGPRVWVHPKASG